ncbi:ribonuclease III [Dichotomicrobium thermohalophilum]|uniref:ribonuclease III n=1 Tax=Dichotomicrobium thermohalophilum TaxID=933063 RepID=UPI000E5A2813|nr:ribonuclease III [Dichotomicrobium thermohalophilum]
MAELKGQNTLPGRLGYEFADAGLLRLALTHPSAQTASSGADYQRLEFLGDRVLGLVVAESLYNTCPQDSEGALARRYNELVHRDTCAAIARSLDLGSHVRMSEAEAASGGAEKAAILADVCESVIGAVFLDGGYDAARDLIHRLWGQRLSEPGPVPIDPKTALQEWAQGMKLPLPEYNDVARTGPDHAPQFTVEARVSGYEPARGTGSSKRAAQEAAATKILVREGVWPESKRE